jgi:hypothetical protein
VRLHSKRVEKMRDCTRNEWRRCEIALETSGEVLTLFFNVPIDLARAFRMDKNIPSLLVPKKSSTLETSGKDEKLHSKRVGKIKDSTRNEWKRSKTTLQTSGEDQKLHSTRVVNKYQGR